MANQPFVLPPNAPLSVPNPGAGAGGVVTPGATVFAVPTRALWVGGAGNVTVTMAGQSVTFVGVPAGTLLPISCTQVTSATATSIVALN